MTLRLTGLIAAAYTPFDEQGDLNLAAIGPMSDHFETTGVRGVFVGGTTGECHSLRVDERRALLRTWKEVAGERLKVVAHVGGNCLPDCVELAADAEAAGADAIGAMSPFFFRPGNIDELAAWLAEIAAAAPKTPFYFYDIPSMTGVALPTDELIQRTAESIPTLNGVKFTRNDNMLLQACIAADGGRFDMLFGHDENLLTGLALGCRGAIGSTYNYATPLYVSLLEAFDRADIATARALQQRSVQLVQVLLKYGVVRGGKAIMNLIGIDCGPVRQPLQPMRTAEIDALRKGLEEIGFFDSPYRS